MPISNIEALNFIRKEISFEYTLLNSRISWLTTCQGFLIATYSLSLKDEININHLFVYWILPVLGISICFLGWKGISGAYTTITDWRTKQHTLISTYLAKGELASIISERFNSDPKLDNPHNSSAWFAKGIPMIFCGVWFLVLLSNFYFLK